MLRYPWAGEKAAYGYALVVGEDVVGVICTCYSEQQVHGRAETFCNLHSWCVHPDYRPESVRLLLAPLRQRDHTFTTLTVSKDTVAFLKRFGFSPIDDKTALLVNPLLALRGWRPRVTTERPAILAAVDEVHRRMLADFGAMRSARATLARRGEDWCLCLSLRERRRGTAATRIVYVSHRPLFTDWLGAFARSFLLRDRTLITTCPSHFLTRRTLCAVVAREPRPQFFKSSRLQAADVTCLYTELTR